MEMIVEGFGMCKKDPVPFNTLRKHHQATFLSDITTVNGGKIKKKLLMSDYQETHEGLLGKIDQRQHLARSTLQRKTRRC